MKNENFQLQNPVTLYPCFTISLVEVRTRTFKKVTKFLQVASEEMAWKTIELITGQGEKGNLHRRGSCLDVFPDHCSKDEIHTSLKEASVKLFDILQKVHDDEGNIGSEFTLDPVEDL